MNPQKGPNVLGLFKNVRVVPATCLLLLVHHTIRGRRLVIVLVCTQLHDTSGNIIVCSLQRTNLAGH